MRSTKSLSPVVISSSNVAARLQPVLTQEEPRAFSLAVPNSVIPNEVRGVRNLSWDFQRRKLLCLCFLLLLPQVLFAAKHPKYGGTLRLELQTAKISLDPREWKPGSVSAAENARLAALVYDRLLTLDDYGRFQPALATEWSHDASLKIWQFKLRPGVRFSDGALLTAKDVAAALQPLLPAGLQISSTENSVVIRSSHAVPDLLE